MIKDENTFYILKFLSKIYVCNIAPTDYSIFTNVVLKNFYNRQNEYET